MEIENTVYNAIDYINDEMEANYGIDLYQSSIILNTINELKQYSNLEITEEIIDNIYECVKYTTLCYDDINEASYSVIDSLKNEFDFDMEF